MQTKKHETIFMFSNIHWFKIFYNYKKHVNDNNGYQCFESAHSNDVYSINSQLNNVDKTPADKEAETEHIRVPPVQTRLSDLKNDIEWLKMIT